MELDLLLLRQGYGNTLKHETFFKSGRGVILSLSIIFSQCMITNANPDTAEAALEYIKDTSLGGRKGEKQIASCHPSGWGNSLHRKYRRRKYIHRGRSLNM